MDDELLDSYNEMISSAARLLPDVAKMAAINDLEGAVIEFVQESPKPRFMGFSRDLKESYSETRVPDDTVIFAYLYDIRNKNDEQQEVIRTYHTDAAIGKGSKLVKILRHEMLVQIGSF